MDLYLDTEFIENKGSIELISIGLVDQTGLKKYYAISSEFDENSADDWVKRNVISKLEPEDVVNRKTKDQIKNDIIKYLEDVMGWKYFPEDNRFAKIVLVPKDPDQILKDMENDSEDNLTHIEEYIGVPEGDAVFWAYFGDYDWVVFCWLFGTMMDLPKGMPMYARDLKQEMDIAELPKQLKPSKRFIHDERSAEAWLEEEIKKQENNMILTSRYGGIGKEAWLKKTREGKKYRSFAMDEHNALVDAQWNRLLHKNLVVWEIQKNEEKAVKEYEALRDEMIMALKSFEANYNKENNSPIILELKFNKTKLTDGEFIGKAALSLEVNEGGIRTLLISKVFAFRNEREMNAEYDWGLKLYREMLYELVGGAITLQLLNIQHQRNERNRGLGFPLNN